MEALFLNSSSTALPLRLADHRGISASKDRRERKFLVHCQGKGTNLKKSSRVSTARASTALVSDRSEKTLERPEGLVLAPAGIEQGENGMKDLVPYTGGSLVELHEGLGIVNFLQGKRFFITGATGFLAKILIEKILRAVPDVGKIYLLIKAKSNEDAVERLKKEIMDSELFKILRQIHGKSYQSFMLSKLVPVVGNICNSDLGLEGEMADEIAEEVDIIVNSAANTTFHERYDVAIDINTKGPCNLMGIAKKCKKLKLFLQVSTAYVNGQRQGIIMEKPFREGDSIAGEILNSEIQSGFVPPLDIEHEMKLASNATESFEEHEASQRMKELGLERARTYGWQDTYVFTKAMGEMVIESSRGEIPVVVIRPSIIESTFSEPFPGWIEGNRMMDPVVLYYGRGQLTAFLADPKGVLDVIPADMVVNATLAAIAKHGRVPKSEINVYQVGSSVVNPLVLEDLVSLVYQHYQTSPSLDSKGDSIVVPTMKLFKSVEDLSDHLRRDALQRSSKASQKAKMAQRHEMICRKSVEQAKYLANIYEPYTFYGGRFDNSNMQSLMKCMSEKERREFGFDVENIDWKEYITNVHIPGLKRHVLKGRGNTVALNCP